MSVASLSEIEVISSVDDAVCHAPGPAATGGAGSAVTFAAAGQWRAGERLHARSWLEPGLANLARLSLSGE
jgi:hypothetical protein